MLVLQRIWHWMRTLTLRRLLLWLGKFNYYKVMKVLGTVREIPLQLCQYQSNELHRIGYKLTIMQSDLRKTCQSWILRPLDSHCIGETEKVMHEDVSLREGKQRYGKRVSISVLFLLNCLIWLKFRTRLESRKNVAVKISISEGSFLTKHCSSFSWIFPNN